MKPSYAAMEEGARDNSYSAGAATSGASHQAPHTTTALSVKNRAEHDISVKQHTVVIGVSNWCSRE